MVATVLVLVALLPVGAASMITGDFSQMVYKPTRRAAHLFLKRRGQVIGASVGLWLLGLVVHLGGDETRAWLLIVTGVLVLLFTLLGYGMSPYVVRNGCRRRRRRRSSPMTTKSSGSRSMGTPGRIPSTGASGRTSSRTRSVARTW